MKKHFILFALFGVLTVSCNSQEEVPEETVSTEPVIEGVTKAYCVIEPTEGNNVVGAVSFTQTEDGVRIIADIGGLTPGKHGFHIHEHGDCSSHDGSSTGGHYNPTNKKHGGPDSEERHIGDFGNLEAGDSGFAHYNRVDKVIELNGPLSIIGKSIIIHADEDDLVSQPTGNAGARVACGLIVQAEE